MSLTWRFLLLVLCLNLGVLGVVQFVSFRLQDRWVEEQRTSYQEIFLQALRTAASEVDVYSLTELDYGNRRHIQALLRVHRIRHLFRDVAFTNGRSAPSDRLALNLLGAAHRDPDQFPADEVREGLRAAMAEGALVPVGEGYCVPLVSNGEPSGAIWYTLQVPPPPPPIPTWVLTVTVLGAAVLLGGLVWAITARTVARPLRRLGAAASRIGAGHYGERVQSLGGAPEVGTLARAFNTMATKVEGHAEELSKEVEAAVDEAKRKERALVVSSRLAAMGTLAAGIAHEINNPIAGMQNAVRRLLERDSCTDRERRYLELVEEGLGRIHRIARRVLDFSPRRVGAEPFALAEAVEGARQLVEHRFRSQGTELLLDLADDLPRLLGDRHELQQVLLNLLINSLDALEEAGRPGRITVRARASGLGVSLEVVDDGPGMPEGELERVLDPFYSAKGRPDASGLGMFISYSIIQNHGGTMELDSVPGEGFRVRIELPRVVAETPEG